MIRLAALAGALVALAGCDSRAPSDRLSAVSPPAEPGAERPADEPSSREAPAGAASADEVPELAATWVGDPTSDAPLLVLLHGYGAPGDDLVPLAAELRASAGAPLRVAALAAPIAMGPRARAWWPIGDGPRPADRGAEATPPGLVVARRAVDRWLAAQRYEPRTTVVAGFSQGAMLATELALRGEARPGALAILSGGPIDEAGWREAARARPPEAVFVSHGRADPLLAFGAAERLVDALRRAGAPTTFVPFDGGHTLAPRVRAGLAAWLRAWLAGERG